MQLWLKSIAGVSEYAMNKPEGEIWPETQVTTVNFYPDEFPENMETEAVGSGLNVCFDLEIFDGTEMNIEVEGDQRDIFDRIAESWSSYERCRTHCPKCWQKIEAGAYLHVEMGGHQSFHCPADNDYDERFPREG